MNLQTFATHWNAELIDRYYEQWLRSPEDLDREWQAFFEGFELGQAQPATSAEGPSPAANGTAPRAAAGSSVDPRVQARFIGAIYAYRSIGHTQAAFNPLLREAPVNPRLTLERLGFEEAHLDQAYNTGNYLGGTTMTVRELLDRLKRTYCGPVGVEYLHIQETPKRRWLQARMEPNDNQHHFAQPEKIRILRKIVEAETFERFLHTRYVGQKRFSLEGGETLIGALDAIINRCPEQGVEEIVMGMAHRGRLNVLANIFGKSYDFIFREFSSNYIPESIHGDGDVKYHLGYETQIEVEGQPMELRLAANPSHLEAVDPVVQGKARARQRIRSSATAVGTEVNRGSVLPVLIHGDAAIAGQGIVAETFNFSKLKGYRTGGTIHLVINNQIGFTTDPEDARSSLYCTDIAKMVEAPIFHVNGNDPLSVAHVCQLALDYRQQFGEDVVIDMYCYRKHGHNESDEPVFTQPVLYKEIRAMKPVSDELGGCLLENGDIEQPELDQIKQEFENRLEEAFKRVKTAESEFSGRLENYREAVFSGSNATIQTEYNFEGAATSVAPEQLEQVARVLTTIPEGFNINPKIRRQVETKWKLFEQGKGLDWAFAESLAFGTLLAEGTPVRISGQDSERGTFSQRHAAWYDLKTRERYVPLLHLREQQAQFCVHNSMLSEAAVLGFDFGYSLEYPQMLAIWEAQFGDFINGAQVIIDQFIVSGESKWGRVSGLVMLLPHGYEGQGPEHSSARLERFLQLCAENNIQVCNLTTPSQYFHVLRRQVKRDFRKPLVIMSPKSLLRHKDCVSSPSEIAGGTFRSVLPDAEPPQGQVRRVIMCSGKVYYDLLAYRREQEIADTALVRLEQFYPLNRQLLGETVRAWGEVDDLVWCQEEPANMGAWSFLRHRLEEIFARTPRYAGRDAAASPAVGSAAIHQIEQESLVCDAFGRYQAKS